MSQSIQRVAVRGASLTLWLVGAGLSGISCRDDDVAGPTDAGAAAETGSALATQAAPRALSFHQISAGSQHTCGTTTDNRAYCWGYNGWGSLGDGTTTYRGTPVAVIGGLRFSQVSAALNVSCGVTPENKAYCWGDALGGALGDGIGGDRYFDTPNAVVGGHRFRQVSAGTCAVTPENVAYCWGVNNHGQVGDGGVDDEVTAPVAVLGGIQFRQVSNGLIHTCGVSTADLAYCWGSNFYGQLGDGWNIDRHTPTRVHGTLRFKRVTAGYYHSCGVTTTDRVYCWGFNGEGQLGDGTTTNRFRPRAVAGGLVFGQVDAGYKHTCAVTPLSRAYCWGLNSQGQLGDRTFFARRLAPVPVFGGLSFRRVDAGWEHTCGVTTDDRGFCWGRNLSGQLGDGTFLRKARPVPVAGAM